MDEGALLQDYDGKLRRLAHRLTRQVSGGPGADFDTREDLWQAGRMAFLEEARRFDLARGATLWTHVYRRVRGSMLAELYQRAGSAPVGVSKRNRWRVGKIKRTERSLYQLIQREPTDWEIAYELRRPIWTMSEDQIVDAKQRGLTREDIDRQFLVPLELVQAVQALFVGAVPLSNPLPGVDDEETLEDVLIDDSPAFTSQHDWYTAVRLTSAVADLPDDREREAVELHYGRYEVPVVDLAAELKVSRQTIHHRIRGGVRKLKAALDFDFPIVGESWLTLRQTTSPSATRARRRWFRFDCERHRLRPLAGLYGPFTFIHHAAKAARMIPEEGKAMWECPLLHVSCREQDSCSHIGACPCRLLSVKPVEHCQMKGVDVCPSFEKPGPSMNARGF